MKRIDLHTHAKLSKRFPFELRSVYQIIAQARRIGLDGVALVEHLHGDNFWGIHDELARVFRYADGAYRADGGFRLLTGAEISLRELCDLVILGTLAQLDRLDRTLTRPATSGYRPPFDEALAAARHAGVFVIGAHMFRPGKELTKLRDEQLAGLDALESNGKDFFAEERVCAAARRLGTPVVGGSDAHFWPQVGIKSTLLPVADITHASVTRAIRDGGARIESLSYGPLAAKISYAYKRIRKARWSRDLAATRRPALELQEPAGRSS